MKYIPEALVEVGLVVAVIAGITLLQDFTAGLTTWLALVAGGALMMIGHSLWKRRSKRP